jgi:hypothetical protein
MNNEQIIKDAQFRKGLSIAFFNATNAAIELTKNLEMTQDVLQSAIVEWRDWFLEEHKNYYSEVIANVGKHYDTEESIKKLNRATNLIELQSEWIFLSEDERQDETIIAEKNKLKEKYAKT